jgi:hypothetical protein
MRKFTIGADIADEISAQIGSYGAARYISQTAIEGASRRALSVAVERSASGVYFVCPVSSPSASGQEERGTRNRRIRARARPRVRGTPGRAHGTRCQVTQRGSAGAYGEDRPVAR